MNQEQKLEMRVENTAVIREPKEDWLLKILGWYPDDVLDLEKITPKRLIWPPTYLPLEEHEEAAPLVLPERLTNPQYGSAELEQNLRELAKKAPGIHKVWEMTKDLPSLTKILLEEREQE